MAVNKGDYLRPAWNMVSGSIPTWDCLETSGQTFKPGELVTMTSGKIALCTTTGNRLASSGTGGTIWGVTATTGKNATGTPAWITTTATVGVIPAMPWMVWEAAVQHGTTASSKIVKTLIGNAYALTRSASNKVWYITLSDTTNLHATVIGFRDATGTQNGHVYFVLHNSARDAYLR